MCEITSSYSKGTAHYLIFIFYFILQIKSPRRVSFSPQLTSVKEYNSPYQDPFFTSTIDGDEVWKRRIARCAAMIKLNCIEEVGVKYIL